MSRSHPKKDICDKLAGDYPKDFVFDGWHPQCFCYVTPITIDEDVYDKLMDEDDWREAVRQYAEKHQITDYPNNFTSWVNDNADKINAARARGTEPYFIRNNAGVIDNILNPDAKPTQPITALSQNAHDLIDHLKTHGNLDDAFDGGLTERDIYRKWDSLSESERLQVLERGKYSGMVSTEEDLDFANLYQPMSKDRMINTLQDELENVRAGYDMEDSNHYIIKFKGDDKIVYSHELEKPLTAAQLKKIEYISANGGLSNYRYWAANDEAKAALMREMGFIEYRDGVVVDSWNGKDFAGKTINDKYIGQNIVRRVMDWKVNREFDKFKTHDEVRDKLNSILEKQLGYHVEITVSPDLIDLESTKAYATEIARLTKRYKLLQQKLGRIEFGYAPTNPIEIGEVYFNHDLNEPKILRLRTNTDARDPQIAIKNSRCDSSRLKFAPATHEFAHLLYQKRISKVSNLEFESKLSKIFDDYNLAIDDAILNRNLNEMSKWYLGNYSDGKINEFMAEAFQEYNNSKRPTKYAILVGELVEKYFTF